MRHDTAVWFRKLCWLQDLFLLFSILKCVVSDSAISVHI